MQPGLGTYVEVCAHARSRPLAEHAVDAAFSALRRAHARWSFHDPDSELSRLNRSPGARVNLSPESLRLLRLALALMVCTDGAFDVTLGGLLVAAGQLPDHAGRSALDRGTTTDLIVGPGWAMLARPVRITLDGIAKGFAVDLAVAALRRARALSGWVNAGGDLRAFGGVTVPIQLRDEGGRLSPVGGLCNLALASSCVSTRSLSHDPSVPGRIVGHETQPAAPGLWSVLATSAWRADALTKVAACTPASRRHETLSRLGGRLVGATP